MPTIFPQAGGFLFKRATTAVKNTYAGLNGEVIVDVSKKALAVMDGTTLGGSTMVPEARTVNGYSLATNIALNWSDVGASPDTHQHNIQIGDGVNAKVNVGTNEVLNIVNGSNILVTYNDTTNTVTIATSSNLAGIAESASMWSTARKINYIGDLSGNVTLDGSSDVTAGLTLNTVNNNIGTFGSSSKVAQVITNAKGLVTGVSEITITPAAIGAQPALGYTAENVVNKVTNFTSPSDTTYPTTLAVSTFVAARTVGILSDCGNWDASTNTFPTTGGSGTSGNIVKGNLWYVTKAGVLGGVTVNIGDSFRALVDNPGQTPANWGVLEANIGYVPENIANRNASSGYAGLQGYALTILNSAGNNLSTIIQSNTAARSYTLPDKSGTVALISDITGINSGTNTGDETTASILTKLSIPSISGVNTGDETTSSIRTKLGISSLSGVNTGDETNASILSKLNLTSISGVNTGDETQTSIVTKLSGCYLDFGVM